MLSAVAAEVLGVCEQTLSSSPMKGAFSCLTGQPVERPCVSIHGHKEQRHCSSIFTALLSDLLKVTDDVSCCVKLGCTKLLFVEPGVKVDSR